MSAGAILSRRWREIPPEVVDFGIGLYDAPPMTWIDRRAEAHLNRLMASSRAVVVNGPRQAGKSALLRRVAGVSGDEDQYVTLDDRVQLRTARLDPVGFLADRSRPLFIDEFQRGGDPLLLAAKAELDRSDERGQLVLAGSTRFLTEPRLSESLAGRIRFLDLWPLSQGEIRGGDDGLMEALLTDVGAVRRRRPTRLSRAEVAAAIATGGLPEAVLLDDELDRRALFDACVRTVTQRDVPDLATVRQPSELDELWRQLAARTAGELVTASIARSVDLPESTTKRYLSLLETVFVFHQLRPFTANLATRVSGRTKAHIVDTGVAAHLIRETSSRLSDLTNPSFGPLFETFVVNELMRQGTWVSQVVDLYHARVHRGPEVDLVAVGEGGRVAAVEVKATASPDPDDAAGLRWLAERVGDRWVQGIIVCLVDRPVPLGGAITAVPVASVWSA
jgi:predicted AAA+ superfamily ATPase